MAISLQKANFFKRISAWLFDAVMCVVLATGVMVVMSGLLNYDFHANKLSALHEQYITQYETEHSVKLNLTTEEYDQLTEEELEEYNYHFDEVYKLIAQDEEIQRLHSVIMNYTFIMISVSLLIVHLIWHFLIPLIFKDGRTLGKKIFGLAVMRTSGLKLTNPILFVRSILGLYTMETMVPVLFVLMIYFGQLGTVGIIATLLIFVLQIVVMVMTSTNSSIHDLLSDTVVVDYASQQIFQTQADLDAYLEEQRAAEAEKQMKTFDQP